MFQNFAIFVIAFAGIVNGQSVPCTGDSVCKLYSSSLACHPVSRKCCYSNGQEYQDPNYRSCTDGSPVQSVCTSDSNCQLDYSCQYVSGSSSRYCCKVPGKSLQQSQCSDGSASMGSCTSDVQCQLNYQCRGGSCCRITGTMCQDGTAPLQGCVLGVANNCPSTFQCVNLGSGQGGCCRSSSQSPDTCPGGQAVIDPTTLQPRRCFSGCQAQVSTSICNPLNQLCCYSLKICTTGGTPQMVNGQPTPCNSGFCSSGNSCDSSTGFCCSSSTTGMCPSGQVSLGSCVNGFSCPTNSQCMNGQCCQSVSIGFCPSGQQSFGQCVGGLCPSGSSCVNNQCCQVAGVCPVGQQSLGSCNSGMCSQGGQCISGQCCQVINNYGSPCSLSSPSMCNVRGATCETGYCLCPKDKIYSDSTRECVTPPKLGESCAAISMCATDNSICDCQGSSCTCKCLASLGYVADGTTCKRARKALTEACTQDAECKSAFSACKSGKCDCRTGFNKDANGGCQPAAFKCSDGSDPVLKNSKIMECERYPLWDMGFTSSAPVTPSKTPARQAVRFSAAPSCSPQDSGMKDTCDTDSYCVPYYDDPVNWNRYRGFCCKKPTPKVPQCPVGQPHESSKAPDYGCADCPFNTHFCHDDPRVSNVQICCPKPCVNPDDLYSDGQCYPVIAYAGLCDADAQCIGKANSPMYPTGMPYVATDAVKSSMKCKQMDTVKKCTCDSGYIEVGGKCVRAKCSSGMQGEPLSDSYGQTVRCGGYTSGSSVSQSCTTGYTCDTMNTVCCKNTVLQGDPCANSLTRSYWVGQCNSQCFGPNLRCYGGYCCQSY